MADIPGKHIGPLTISLRPFGVAFGDDGIDQRVKMQGKGHIVVARCTGPSRYQPSPSRKASTSSRYCSVSDRSKSTPACVSPRSISKRKNPVVVDEFLGPCRDQIGGDRLFLGLAQRIPDELRHHGDGKTDGGKLHLSLVGARNITPIFRVARIRFV